MVLRTTDDEACAITPSGLPQAPSGIDQSVRDPSAISLSSPPVAVMSVDASHNINDKEAARDWQSGKSQYPNLDGRQGPSLRLCSLQVAIVLTVT